MEPVNEQAQGAKKKIGWGGYIMLSSAALTKGVAGIVRDDVKNNRAAMGIYGAGIGVVAVIGFLVSLPVPIIPVGAMVGLAFAVAFAGGVKGLSKLGISKWARHKDEKFLRDIFNREALIKRYDALIIPSKDDPGTFHVHKRQLIASVFKKVSDDAEQVSPTGLKKFVTGAKEWIEPKWNRISGVFNRITGRTPEAGKTQQIEAKPPEPPQP